MIEFRQLMVTLPIHGNPPKHVPSTDAASLCLRFASSIQGLCGFPREHTGVIWRFWEMTEPNLQVVYDVSCPLNDLEPTTS